MTTPIRPARSRPRRPARGSLLLAKFLRAVRAAIAAGEELEQLRPRDLLDAFGVHSEERGYVESRWPERDFDADALESAAHFLNVKLVTVLNVMDFTLVQLDGELPGLDVANAYLDDNPAA